MPTNTKTPNAASDSRNELMFFQFDAGSTIHVEMHDGEPIFLAKDVCDALGIQNVTVALRNLEDDEKLTYAVHRAGQKLGSVVPTPSGQRRNANFVNESGLYSLIFQSRKPKAKEFRRWVTGKVLPEIRKTGSYAGRFASLDKYERDERIFYRYADVLKVLEYKKSGSNYKTRLRYFAEFKEEVDSEGKLVILISKDYASIMSNRRIIRNAMQVVKERQLSLFPNQETKEVSHG